MEMFPDTRASLILKIGDSRDAQAWDEFVHLYRPVIYRLARQRGLQDADAQEVVQEALLAVSRKVEHWVPDVERGRFRDWLFVIARNISIDFLTRRKHRAWGNGAVDYQHLLQATAGEDPALIESFDIEYHREMLRLAAERVQGDVKERTWRAFWMCAVEETHANEVAQRLRMSIGSVYIARSRVLARLRKEVQRLEGQVAG
jgi:RNA polymerase sigma-70 factor (ECF subfamily)